MSSKIRVQRICEHCGNQFTAQTTVTRFCSHLCNSRAYKANAKAGKIERSNIETKNVIVKPIEELKAKPFLSIAETSKLLGISRRTIYRMFERGELRGGKAGKRVIIQRSDIDRLFS
jgi:excisionase family DNA binding protein